MVTALSDQAPHVAASSGHITCGETGRDAGASAQTNQAADMPTCSGGHHVARGGTAQQGGGPELADQTADLLTTSLGDDTRGTDVAVARAVSQTNQTAHIVAGTVHRT